MNRKEMIEWLDHISELLGEMLKERTPNWDDIKKIIETIDSLSWYLNRGE